jgi:hypothetical protein
LSLDQAARCRRLAEGLPDEALRQKLLVLAVEYDAKARSGVSPLPTRLALRCASRVDS